jgi:MYXO-CTERM domain-containing protein
MKSTMRIVVGGAAAAMLSLLGARDVQAFGKQTIDSGVIIDGRCGTPHPILECARVDNSGPQPRRTMFLNRNGGSYAYADETDSSSNKISLKSGTTNAGGSIPALTVNEQEWTEIKSCVAAYYSGFNIDVVDVEPDASTPYIEMAVGGSESDIHFDAGLGGGAILLGIASTNQLGHGCDVEERGIAFAFAANHGNLTNAGARKLLCDTIAHEAGHLLGLEHEIKHADLMSYEDDALGKSFMDFDSQCGTYEASPTPCICGDESTQNSYKVLMDNLGPNETTKPTLSITEPAEGATVNPGFTVKVDAADNNKVAKVELLIDGNVVASDLLSPFALVAPAAVPVGPLSIEVRAYDKSSNMAAATRALTVEPGCLTASDCESDEQCLNGACLGDVGHPCEDETDCLDSLCVAGAGPNSDKYCTHTCSPGADECPSGFACDKSTGNVYKCNPAEGGGCGCRAGGRTGSAGLSGLAMAGLATLLFLARRRRARAARA